jgi:hypothetical protein
MMLGAEMLGADCRQIAASQQTTGRAALPPTPRKKVAAGTLRFCTAKSSVPLRERWQSL